jgi:hypothetical protein
LQFLDTRDSARDTIHLKLIVLPIIAVGPVIKINIMVKVTIDIVIDLLALVVFPVDDSTFDFLLINT